MQIGAPTVKSKFPSRHMVTASHGPQWTELKTTSLGEQSATTSIEAFHATYLLRESLGTGGFASVRAAVCRASKQRVAVKRLTTHSMSAADIETEVEAFETEAASLEAEADVLGAEVQEAAAEAAYAESVAEEEDRKAKDAADAVAALPPRSDDGADVDIVYVTKPKGGAVGLAGLFTAIVAAATAFV